ncbi:MAG: DUF3797 domain-containing protein [Candidatus Peribacteraceae bacterium]|nr:DUF3797 domain-containing protein [Candidatus Peribacteraceae bacterium]MBP9850165.1 DUF3797 domain-containing protein [Candidatus Peribacteraceae bacterium]
MTGPRNAHISIEYDSFFRQCNCCWNVILHIQQLKGSTYIAI